MIDLPIGTRFYFEDKLVEVVEGKTIDRCFGCVLKNKVFKDGYGENEMASCYSVECCRDERKDKTDVYFKEVKE